MTWKEKWKDDWVSEKGCVMSYLHLSLGIWEGGKMNERRGKNRKCSGSKWLSCPDLHLDSRAADGPGRGWEWERFPSLWVLLIGFLGDPYTQHPLTHTPPPYSSWKEHFYNYTYSMWSRRIKPRDLSMLGGALYHQATTVSQSQSLTMGTLIYGNREAD